MSKGRLTDEPVLVISQSRSLVRRVAGALASIRVGVESVGDGRNLERHRRHRPYLLSVVDVRGPSGRELADRCMRARPGERYLFLFGRWERPAACKGNDTAEPFGFLREGFEEPELRAWVRRAAVEARLQRGDQSLEDLLYGRFRHFLQDLGNQPMAALHDLVWEHVERPLITAVLEQTGGNQSRAAEILGIHRNTLRAKIRALNIDPSRASGLEW